MNMTTPNSLGNFAVALDLPKWNEQISNQWTAQTSTRQGEKKISFKKKYRIIEIFV